MDKPPRIVAELGRPETPEETAARKAAASRRHRQNQTARNLVFALIACLGIVVLVVLVVVRPSQTVAERVDWSEAAEQEQPGIDTTLADPELPEGWTANAAMIDVRDGVTTWYIGFITPDNGFIGMRQGIDADAGWTAAQIDDAQATGTTDVDGVQWDQYDRRDRPDPGNRAFAMTAESGASTYVLYGTADDDAFSTLASAVVAEFDGGTTP